VSAAGTRAVLIDALGTLVALAPPAPRLVAALRERHGLELDPAQAEQAVAREMTYYREHHQEACDEHSLAELRRRCAQVLAAELPERVVALGEQELVELLLASLHFSAQEDAERSLQALRESGLKLIAVSNWDCSLPAIFDRIGLGGSLDGVVTSGALGVRKPDVRIFAAALELAGVAASAAVHVGDSIANDVQGALGAGIAAVLLRRPSKGTADTGAACDPPEGVPVISTLDELPNVIQPLRRLGSVE
jgi:HAD superfamily hydrolase (TIGR01509 family)